MKTQSDYKCSAFCCCCCFFFFFLKNLVYNIFNKKNIYEMTDLIKDKVDGFLVKLNANNLIVISQNLNIDI